MPSMITTCPACSRKGIMAKRNGLCFHCNKNSTPAKVTPIVAAATPAAPVHHAPSKSLKRLGVRLIKGRVAR